MQSLDCEQLMRSEIGENMWEQRTKEFENNPVFNSYMPNLRLVIDETVYQFDKSCKYTAKSYSEYLDLKLFSREHGVISNEISPRGLSIKRDVMKYIKAERDMYLSRRYK